MKQKNEIRTYCIKKRKSFEYSYIQNVSNCITEKILNLEVYKNAKNIFLYLSIENEINTKNLLENCILDKKNVYCPVVTNKNHIITFKKYSKNLVKNKWGILEPTYEEKQSDSNSLIIVPALSYNKQKYRIGYGGGYYDTYLKNNVYLASVCLCFDEFLFDFENDIYDEKLDIIVTQKNIY